MLLPVLYNYLFTNENMFNGIWVHAFIQQLLYFVFTMSYKRI